jgi:hypothetical protein
MSLNLRCGYRRRSTSGNPTAAPLMSNVIGAAAGTNKEKPPVLGSGPPRGMVLRITPSLGELPAPDPDPPLFEVLDECELPVVPVVEGEADALLVVPVPSLEPA